ncbi:MAG: riboflavin synthase, partial [Candidatus Acidiferrales bacterium]
MFTGLVQSLAEVADVLAEPPGVRLVIREPRLAPVTKVGDSVALNGCCLTVVAVNGERLSFQ